MSSRCIGVFDSGLGGLTCLKEIMNILPGEATVYFGDTARVPYGARTAEELVSFAGSDIKFLQSHNPKVIVIACGTVSSVALPVIGEEIETPVFGVIDASVVAAIKATKNHKIGIIATEASVRSGAYEKRIKNINPEIETVAVGCPLFVPLVEAGKTNSDEARAAAREYLAPIKAAGVDTLILGCTHYPLLREVIAEIVGTQVTLIDPGKETAASVKDYLEKNNILSELRGESKFYVSGDPVTFKKLAGEFLEQEIETEVEKIDIEKYM